MATTSPSRAHARIAAPAAAATPPRTEDPDPSPWAEIELNYFNSMRLHREQQDRDLDADHRARAGALRQQLVANYDAQTELLRRLRELKGEYEAGKARLDGLEVEVKAVKEGRLKERAREDVERRAWFERYRRGGLAYREAEEEEGTGKSKGGEQEEEKVEEKVALGANGRAAVEEQPTEPEPPAVEDRMAGVGEEEKVNGYPDGAADQEPTIEEPTSTQTATEKQTVQQSPRVDAGPLVNGLVQEPVTAQEIPDADNRALEGGESVPASPPDLDKATPDTDVAMSEDEQQAPQALEEAAPDVARESLSAQQETPPAIVDRDMADAGTLSNGQAAVPEMVEKDVADAVANADAEARISGQNAEPEVVEHDMTDAGALPNGQDEKPVVAGKDVAPAEALDGQAKALQVETMSETGTSVNGYTSETAIADHNTGDPERPDDDTVMGGVEDPERRHTSENIGAAELDRQQPVEAPRPERQTDVATLIAEPEAQDTQPAQRSFQATVESEDEQPLSARLADEDVEMSDARPATENNTSDNRAPEEPSPTTPAAPPSPSSSSELSSRHTTPELDTPASLIGEPSPAVSPARPAPNSVEVVGDYGALIAVLQAPDRSNTLASRLVDRPIMRPVQIRPGRKFTADDLDSVPRPLPGDSRAFKFLSLYIQATGEVQELPCSDCALSHGLYQDCVVVDDPDFPRCGNCVWNKRRCHGAGHSRPSSSRHSVSAKSPTKARSFGGSFTSANHTPRSQKSKVSYEDVVDDDDSDWETNTMGANKVRRKSLPSANVPRKSAFGPAPPRKSLPSANVPRKSLPGGVRWPTTPLTGSFQSNTDDLAEITKEVLCLRHDGVVYTDPPMMRGVPLAKISRDHPYWEPSWRAIEEIVEPVRLKHQEKYEQLERAGSTHPDKHLANRDAKRGRIIYKFLEEGDLHPYQLVGKQWINQRITNYDTLFRLAQLLLEELPKMNLDVKPSDWLRHRLWEVYQEKGPKFDVASWIGKAYHDRKIEWLRQENGFARVGRPPAHATKNLGTSSTSKKPKSAPQSKKRKDPHQTPESTPSKHAKVSSEAINASPSAASSVPGAGETKGAAAATEQQRPKKIKIITSRSQSISEPLSAKGPKIVLNSPFPPSAGPTAPPHDAEHPLSSALDYDGYTSSDSISGDRLHSNDWRLRQVKTRTFASNPHVTQYWHWVGGDRVIEHQVLESVRPIKWSIFKKPYNFHLKLGDIQEVSFARGSTRVIIAHKKGRDGRDMNARGDIMAQFKRDRTKKRFLVFLARDKGVKLVEVDKETIESRWNALDPETLLGPDSD